MGSLFISTLIFFLLFCLVPPAQLHMYCEPFHLLLNTFHHLNKKQKQKWEWITMKLPWSSAGASAPLGFSVGAFFSNLSSSSSSSSPSLSPSPASPPRSRGPCLTRDQLLLGPWSWSTTCRASTISRDSWSKSCGVSWSTSTCCLPTFFKTFSINLSAAEIGRVEQLAIITFIIISCKIFRANLRCFKIRRNHLRFDSVSLLLNSLIFSHFPSGLTSWSQNSQSAVKSVECCYNPALKISAKNTVTPMSHLK